MFCEFPLRNKFSGREFSEYLTPFRVIMVKALGIRHKVPKRVYRKSQIKPREVMGAGHRDYQENISRKISRSFVFSSPTEQTEGLFLLKSWER